MSAEELCREVKKNLTDEIEFMHDLTVASGVEHGASVCQDQNKQVLMGTKCSGDECSVEYPPCPLDSKIVGSVHFHTDEPALMLSSADIENAQELGEILTCVGDEKDKVACYQVGDVSSQQIQQMQTAEKTYTACGEQWGARQPLQTWEAVSEQDLPPPVVDAIMEKCGPAYKAEINDVLKHFKKCVINL